MKVKPNHIKEALLGMRSSGYIWTQNGNPVTFDWLKENNYVEVKEECIGRTFSGKARFRQYWTLSDKGEAYLRDWTKNRHIHYPNRKKKKRLNPIEYYEKILRQKETLIEPLKQRSGWRYWKTYQKVANYKERLQSAHAAMVNYKRKLKKQSGE